MADGSTTASCGSRDARLTGQARPSPHRIAYPRQRTIKACDLCRARRIKCDGTKPACSSCQKVGVECVRSGADGALLDVGSVRILERLDDLEGIVKSLLPKDNGTRNVPQTAEKDRQLHITTEEVLSWSVFQGQYDSRRNLKSLLLAGSPAAGVASPITVDSSVFGGDMASCSPQRMLDNFFQSIHVKNPMLDERKTRQMVHQMFLEGPAWNNESCLALLICALGSITPSFDLDPASSDYEMSAAAESYFSAAQRRLGILTGSGGVMQAQCFFYSGVYLMSKLQPLAAWRLFCQALACCQDFACADPSYQARSGRVDCPELPAEDCVYWSCWKSEHELRKLLKLPNFPFNTLSYPSLFPTPPASIQEQQTTSWYFYLSEISLRRLEHRVRDEITNALGVDSLSLLGQLDQCTRTLEDLAREWAQSLPAEMSLQTTQEEDDVLKFILRGHLLDLWEVVYWPWLDIFINHQANTPVVQAYLVKAFQVAVDRIRINKPGFRHRHHGTWLMLQSCTRSALVLLAAAYNREAALLLPDGWRDAVFETKELLRFWHNGAGDTSDRLQILEELSAGIE